MWTTKIFSISQGGVRQRGALDKGFYGINEAQYASVMSKKYNSNLSNSCENVRMKDRGLKDCIDKDKMGNGWENMIEEKVVLDDSELDISDNDPMATFYAEESISFAQTGIHKNSIPIFITKTMEMTRWTSEYNKVTTFNIFDDIEDEYKNSNPLNKLVSKMPINSSVQIWK